MRHKKYKVFFKHADIIVRSFNEKEAKILAQAQAIKNGWDYEVMNIKEITEWSAQSNRC